ncbi:MAG: outer membrane lipoprotein-sorting protein [Bradymonadia bacterium]
MRSLTLALMMLAAMPVASMAQDPAPAKADGQAPAQDEALGAEQLQALLVRMDERRRSVGDYASLAFIEQKEKNKNDLVYEAMIYRRDEDERFMILFTNPRAEAGKGYLRIERNLWMYDPNTGKWERRTERERIGGTDSRRADFDVVDLSKDFNATYMGTETLGRFKTWHIKLEAKAGVDVAYPVIEVWVDAESENTLKQQERALSGRLMRTLYYPKWSKVFSETKGAEVHYPLEIRIYDEVEKGNRTTIAFKQVALKPLPANMFTKAWLESKSR